jgi:hypothetical protein
MERAILHSPSDSGRNMPKSLPHLKNCMPEKRNISRDEQEAILALRLLRKIKTTPYSQLTESVPW